MTGQLIMKTIILAVSTVAISAAAMQLSATETLATETPCEQSLSASFIESAPRDRFQFTNLSSDQWLIKTIAIDLAGSAGQLIFDTREGGDGVEVFQQYQTESGSATVAQVTQPEDAQIKCSWNFQNLKTSNRVLSQST